MAMSTWSKVGSFISDIAPTIGTAIGGPAGLVAGYGIKTLCSFFGVDSESDDAMVQVEQALQNMTPEQAISLKKSDNDFQARMKELDVDVYKLEQADKDSARSNNKGTYTPTVLAYAIIAGFVAVCISIFFVKFTDMSNVQATLIGTMFGHISAKVNTILDYFFGSSWGSKEKDGNINRVVDLITTSSKK